ncbi:hypothetical protein HDA32_004673 [Spinactinospora alkalitolerans]|uniref:Uncharacterized protein n=1 Tax=Spinactinospora alkalitolerans TaxID=687207 RepID=A0A852U3R0_9ACTN|nr:hypothetical protein [Spinactinospora alkalitolerans]NYE49553.1 hypothetical protein [Spinactinospora alkalitolerans]
MGHRHPSRLQDAEIAHPRARWLLRAELAYCKECMNQGEKEALSDLRPEGMFDSLWQGWILQQVAKWRDPKRKSAFPAMVSGLAPPHEVASLHILTRECMWLCSVHGARGTKVDSSAVLDALSQMSRNDRSLVLDDVLDGLAEGNAVA